MTAPGTPCWVDLNVADVEVAQAFYGAVCGWAVADGTATVDGRPVAGISPQAPGMSATWTLCLASADLDADVAAVERHGGTVFLPDGRVGGARTAIVGDPSGAHVGLRAGGPAVDRLWQDLRSTDPDAARAFYAALYGWSYDAVAAAGPTYATFSLGGPPLGGVGGMLGEPDGTPSHWLVVFPVADADAAADAAQASGGSVLVAGHDSAYGRSAVLLDPFGARFRVLAR